MPTEFEKLYPGVDKPVDNSKNDPNAVIDPLTGKAPEPLPKVDTVLEEFDRQVRGDVVNPRNQSNIKNHNHDGANSEPIDIRNVKGLLEVLTVVPTSKPSTFAEQLKIVVTGGNTYLYVFDPVANDWLGVQLTT